MSSAHIKRKSLRKKICVVFGLFVVALAFLTTGYIYLKSGEVERTQKKLDPFYTASYPIPANPGTLLKKERLDFSVPNLKAAYRILYVTEGVDGKERVSSGMVFIPSAKAPVGGRAVLAWAHGTLGMADACAPSRSVKPLGDMQWLEEALAQGWVVTATDYAGLGTVGTSYYLIGKAEAQDVLNSVRVVKNMPEVNAGDRFVLYGHSQGGHSVLWSAKLASDYAPELNLVAVAAAAPAAELSSLLNQEYDKAVSWGIGPEIAVAWPDIYPNLDLQNTLSKGAYNTYKNLSLECLNENPLGIKARVIIGKPFFAVNPTSNAGWVAALDAESAPYLDSHTPLIIAQGLNDEVVLPNTTALYAKNACGNNSNLTMMWMGDVGHIPIANTAGPFVVSWLEQRLEGIPVTSNCNQPL